MIIGTVTSSMYVQSSVLYTVRIESGYIFIKNNQSWNHKSDNDSILHKYYNFWLTKAKGKCPPLCRRHFEVHFLVPIVVFYMQISHFFRTSPIEYMSNNALAPNRRQTFIWTNKTQFIGTPYTCLDLKTFLYVILGSKSSPKILIEFL